MCSYLSYYLKAVPKNTWSNPDKYRYDEDGHDREDELTNEISLNPTFVDRLYKVVSDFVAHAKKAKRPSPKVERPSAFVRKGCYIKEHGLGIKPIIKSPMPQDYVPDYQLPSNWDWR